MSNPGRWVLCSCRSIFCFGLNFSNADSLKLNQRPKHPRYIPSIWLRFDELSRSSVFSATADQFATLQMYRISLTWLILSVTESFNNMRTLKFKAQPTNEFFATVNQMFAGSSQLSTAAERAVIKSLCTV